MSDIVASAAGGGRRGEGHSEVAYINNKPHLPEEFKYFRSGMLDTINKEARHVGICLSFFQQIIIEEHLYIGFSAVEQIVKQFNARFYNQGAMILLNVNGNKYTGDINIVEMKLVLMNDKNPEGMTEFITIIEDMFNAAGTQANEYIKEQEQHPHQTSKTEDVECYVPIVADDSTQEIVRMSPLEYEVGAIYSGDDIPNFYLIDAKYNTVGGDKCVPKFLFYKSYPDPNNPDKTKLYRSCGYVFDNAGKQFQIFMFNYKSQTLPFVYLFDDIDKKYVAMKIQKNKETPGSNSYTIISYDGQKIFDMDLTPSTITGDLTSVASSVASSENSSAANSRSISRGSSYDPRLVAPQFPPISEVKQFFSWKQYDREGTEAIMQLLYPKEYIDDDDDDDDDDEYEDEDEEEEEEEEEEEALRDLLKFTVDKTIPLPTFPGSSFGNFARLDNLKILPNNPKEFFEMLHKVYSTVPELVCRYFFLYGDLKNFYLNGDLSEFDSEDIYTFEQKETVLICLSQMNIMSKGDVDLFFIEYISKQKFDLLKGKPCNLIRIGNDYADENINRTTVKTSTAYVDVPMETPLVSILGIIPTSLSNIISGSLKMPQPADSTVGNGLIAITNGEKQLTPPSLETMDELFKDSLFSLFRTPREDLPCLFDIFGNMCVDINATFPGLAYAIIAGGGPFALLGTGKIADVDCMIIIMLIYLNLVKQFLVEKITDIMHFINENRDLYFPGPFEFYLNDERTHFYRVVFNCCKVRIHGDGAKIKRLHSLDLVFDYYEIRIINNDDGTQTPTVFGKFEKSFAALDVVIKVFTGDNTGDIWDKQITDLPSFAEKYIILDRNGLHYPAWNISGMLLALISTLDPETINPNMRELVGKLLNECKRPKFVLDLLIIEGGTDERLIRLNDVLTELISGGTVTASIMEEKKVFEMLLFIVQNIPPEFADMLFLKYIQPKLFITNMRNRIPMIDPQTPGFLPQKKKNDVVILSMGGEGAKGGAIILTMGDDNSDASIMGDAKKYMSVALSMEITGSNRIAEQTLQALESSNGDYDKAKMLFQQQQLPPITVIGSFAPVQEVLSKSGGGRALEKNDLIYGLDGKILGKTISVINSLKWFANNNGIVVGGKTKSTLIEEIINRVDSDKVVSFINETYKGGARRTRHRANKPVKTRKHGNHDANRNTRKRRPRKTIRK
jgi:hypothetical protein